MLRLPGVFSIAPGVHQFATFGARVTALLSDDGVVLVDAGGPGSLRLVARGLKAVGTSLKAVRLIVATHCHPDHVGGLARLVKATSATVVAHRLEAPFIGGRLPMPPLFRHHLLSEVVTPIVAPLRGEPTNVDCPLDDGDYLPFGEPARAMHLPGHTPGSLALYLPGRRLLVVGDALQYRFRRLTPPAGPVTLDPARAMDSIRRLLGLDLGVICFSHFPPLRGDANGAVARLVRRLEAAEAH